MNLTRLLVGHACTRGSTDESADGVEEVHEQEGKHHNIEVEVESKERIKRQKADSLQAKRDSVALIRDSIRENTPRILETFALPDSMLYKRIIQWTHEREFHKMDIKIPEIVPAADDFDDAQDHDCEQQDNCDHHSCSRGTGISSSR